ncbi:hypothetical protein DPMN_039948 [Dreissena polymorpha]|uniref:Uncharacterized protein n=1 Tax=Dreissena polymorpha TaxID=45954 RepID=A0A9D4CWT8_DREPO|nr:hypothetical protein DPMN_039948 [Dreissena polymorpha]
MTLCYSGVNVVFAPFHELLFLYVDAIWSVGSKFCLSLCCVRIRDRFNKCRWYRVPLVSPTCTYLRQRRQLTAYTKLDDLQSTLFLTLYFLLLGSVK